MEHKIVIHGGQELIEMLTAYAYYNNESKSKASQNIIKDFFNDLGCDEKNRLLDIYKKLTPEQRKRPGSYYSF